MRNVQSKLVFSIAGLVMAAPLFAFAGQGCSEQPITAQTLRSAMDAAQRVQAELNKTDRRVVMLGRVGQDLSQYGLKYSHVGYLYRNEPSQPWHVVHLLNTCGTGDSDLWYEGLANFFLDDMFSYDALVLVPPPEVAERLLARFNNPVALRSIHDPAYSLVAYPFSQKYENSNTWILETTAAAESKDATVKTRDQAQAWLKLAGYKPTEMNIGPFKRLGGRMFKANVAFDDHPSDLRYADRIQTVTVDSVKNFLMGRNEGWQAIEIQAPRVPR